MKQLLKSWPLRLNILSIVAVGSAVALDDRPWLTVGLALAVFAVDAWRYRDGVATIRSARALAAFALLVTVWNNGGLDRWPLLLAGAGMMLFITSADIVARALNVGYLQAYNLNIVRNRRERWTAPPTIARMMSLLSLLYTLAAMPAGRFGFATDLAFMVIAAAAFGWTTLAVLRNYLHRRTVSHPVDIQVISAVRRLQPRFVIHFAGSRESEYQLTMWLDYFKAVGDPYLIIIRDRYLVDGIASRTDAPIVFVPAQSVLATLLPESVRACYYVNHAVKNAQLVKLDKYLHVQLMHGDSDKAISRSPVALMYDRVFVAGQAGIDRYHRHGVDIPNYKFRKIGRPQLHDIQVGRRNKIEGGRQTVLYTPTWTGLTADVNYSSLKQGRKIVQALLEREVDIIFRTHPYTRTNAAYQALAEEIKGIIAADAAATGRTHLWGEQAERAVSLTDCINAADVAISDISGTASDWLYCGRPFAMTDPKGFKERYLQEFPLAKAAYLLDPDVANIERVLDELLERDSKADLRAATREYYLGDIKPGELVDLFKAEIKATYEKPVHKTATGESALTAAA